jgi:uncharacterized coiled-coil protein SlyX
VDNEVLAEIDRRVLAAGLSTTGQTTLDRVAQALQVGVLAKERIAALEAELAAAKAQIKAQDARIVNQRAEIKNRDAAVDLLRDAALRHRRLAFKEALGIAEAFKEPVARFIAERLRERLGPDSVHK